MPDNQNNSMTKVWSKQWKYIILITFMWYDNCNNVDVDSKLQKYIITTHFLLWL